MITRHRVTRSRGRKGRRTNENRQIAIYAIHSDLLRVSVPRAVAMNRYSIMRNLGSKLFVLVVAALIVAGLAYAFLPRPVEVDLVKVERGTVRVTVDEDGKTRIHDKYVVSAPLNGRILRINMRAGRQSRGRQDTAHDDRAARPGAARCPEHRPGRGPREGRRGDAASRWSRSWNRPARRRRLPKRKSTRMRKAFAGQGRLAIGGRKRRDALSPAERRAAIGASFRRDRAVRTGASAGGADALAAATGRRSRRRAGQHDRQSAEARSERELPETAIRTRAAAPSQAEATTTAGTSRSIRRSTAACCACSRKAPPW